MNIVNMFCFLLSFYMKWKEIHGSLMWLLDVSASWWGLLQKNLNYILKSCGSRSTTLPKMFFFSKCISWSACFRVKEVDTWSLCCRWTPFSHSALISCKHLKFGLWWENFLRRPRKLKWELAGKIPTLCCSIYCLKTKSKRRLSVISGWTTAEFLRLLEDIIRFNENHLGYEHHILF